MTKTVFVLKTPIMPSYLNGVNNRKFKKNPEFDGEDPLITNDDLSDEPGQLLPEWQSFRDELRVSAGTGLSANYTGGRVGLLNGDRAVIAPGTVALTDNAVNYIYVNDSGVVVSSLLRSSSRVPLARITTLSGAIVGLSAIDERIRGYEIHPPWGAVKTFGGYGEQGDFIVSGNVTLMEGIYRFRRFIVNSTAVITIPSSVKIITSEDSIIDGDIILPAVTGGGIGSSVIATTAPLPGNGPGRGAGGVGGRIYNFELSRAGSSGASGGANFVDPTPSGYRLAQGGDGGSYFILESAGQITLRGKISAPGGDALPAAYSYGAAQEVSGAGGGSGGFVALQSRTGIFTEATSLIDVSGGNGSEAVNNPNIALGANAFGGGGGGGGIALISAPSGTASLLGTINRSGGLQGDSLIGSNVSGGGTSGGGGGGYGGTGGSSSNVAVTPYRSNPGEAGLLYVRSFTVEI